MNRNPNKSTPIIDLTQSVGSSRSNPIIIDDDPIEECPPAPKIYKHRSRIDDIEEIEEETRSGNPSEYERYHSSGDSDSFIPWSSVSSDYYLSDHIELLNSLSPSFQEY
jgi:hypothetical protein